MNYNEFNKVLNSIFFDGRFKQLPIYLDLEDDIKDELDVGTKIFRSDFDLQLGQIVKSRLTVDSVNPYSKFEVDTREWLTFNKAKLPPPFTTLLCLLSLAAERMNSDDRISGTNYYVRLNELLGINENDTLARSLKNHSKLTEQFWLELNRWLTKNDFDYGIPTAKAFLPNWKYVSYAWSQALIRDADRKNLEKFFMERNFVPKQVISQMEMQLHLNEWMMPNKASTNLLRIWNDDNTRNKVIDASIQHINDWTGNNQNNDIEFDTKRELLMIGSISDFPLKLNLEIVSYAIKNIENYKFILDDAEIEYQSKFLKIYHENIKEFGFDYFLGHEFSILSNVKEIFEYLLQTKIILKSNAINEKLQFNPKPIRVLLKDENSPFFKENPRVVFFKKHIILCSSENGWNKRVNEHLVQSARHGFKKFNHLELKGLPKNWVLFTDVEIISAVDTSDQLNVLVPLLDGSILELTGGLKLNQSIYHSYYPPIIQVSSNDNIVQINFGEEKFNGEDSEYFFSKNIKGLHEEQIEQSLSINLKNLKISLIEKGRKSKEKIIHFRNANEPKVINFNDNQLNYSPSNLDKGWPLSANKINKNSISFINGMIIDSVFENNNNNNYQISKSALFKNTLDEGYTEIKESEFNKYSDLIASEENCIVRGYHIYVLPYAKEFKNQKKVVLEDGICKFCQVRLLKNKQKKNILENNTKQTSNLIIIPLRLEHQKVDIDYGLFDSLCYLGEGSWNTFVNLTNTFNNDAFFTKSFLRDLIHLGHIDVQYNQNCQPILWKVNPPCLVEYKKNSYYLSGFRNEKLLKNIKNICEKFNGEFEIHNNKNSVSSYFIKFSSDVNIQEQLSLLKDHHEREVKIVKNFGNILTKMLPAIYETLIYFNSVHIEPSDQLEYFSADEGRWKKSNHIDLVGSYRIRLHGQRYFIKLQDGTLIETFHEIAKIYSCILNGIRYHDYDKNNQVFTSIIGCQPPVLYSRALVSCSGLLPEQLENKLIYKNIQDSIGEVLINKLYYKGLINV